MAEAITAAAGHNMGEIYEEAAKHNRTIVGGADPNVGIGGYITGGGHSPLGSEHGMAVDNVLEIAVATPDGKIIVANECQNIDTFWAMRGGGGATFGVLLNVTLRAHPIPSVAFVRLDFNSTYTEAEHNSNAEFYDTAAEVIADLPHHYSAGVSGYFSLMPISNSSSSSRMNFAFLVFSLDSSESYLLGKLNATMSRINRRTGLTHSISSGWFPSYRDFQSTFLTAAAVGTNRITVSRLWDRAAVNDTIGVANALREFSSLFLQGTVVSGEGVQSKPFAANGLNPAWRRTIVHMMSTITFPLGIDKSKEADAMSLADKLASVLRMQAPNTGCYVNEAHVREPNYQEAFWGDNYDRLLRVKRVVDPHGVFWCPICVGAEDWSLREDSTLCKISR